MNEWMNKVLVTVNISSLYPSGLESGKSNHFKHDVVAQNMYQGDLKRFKCKPNNHLSVAR